MTAADGEGRAIARNTIASYGFRVLRGLSVLLLTPYLFRSLGLAQFGTYGILITLATVFSLVELGVSVGLTKSVAEHRSRGDRRELDEDVGVAVALLGLLGPAACAIVVGVGVWAGGLASPSDRDAFRLGLIVVGASMLVRLPLFAYGAALQGYQRFDLFYRAEAVAVLIVAAGSVAAVEAGTGVLGLAVVYAASQVAGGVMFAILLHRVDPELSLRPRLGDGERRRRAAGFGGLALVADSMEFVAQRMDVLIVAALRNASTAAPLVAAMRLVSGMQALVLPFVNLIVPMVADLLAREAHDEVRRRFVLATRVALQVTLPVAAGLALFATDVIDVWLGDAAPPVTDDILIVLMGAQLATLTSLPAGKVLLASGRLRTLAGLACLEGVSNVALSIVLVIRYGVIGAVVGTLLTTAVIVLVRLPLAARATGCPGRRLFADGLLPALTATAPAIAAMVAARLLLDAGLARLAVGLVFGWGLASAVGIAQVGPRRVLGLFALGRRPAVP